MVLNVSAMPWAISTRNIVFKNFFTLPIVVDSLLLTSSLQPAHLLHERGGQQRHQGQRQQELPGERHDLVIPVTRKRAPDPREHEDEAIHLSDQPERRRDRRQRFVDQRDDADVAERRRQDLDREPAAEEHDGNQERDDQHVYVLGHEEEAEPDAAVLRHEPGHQFALGLREVEGHAVRLGDAGDEIEEEGQRPHRQSDEEPPLLLGHYDVREVQRTRKEHHGDDRERHGDLIADHLGGRTEPAHERIFIVRGPPRHDHAVGADARKGKNEKDPDVQVRDPERHLLGQEAEEIRGRAEGYHDHRAECHGQQDERRKAEYRLVRLGGNDVLLQEKLHRVRDGLEQAVPAGAHRPQAGLHVGQQLALDILEIHGVKQDEPQKDRDGDHQRINDVQHQHRDRHIPLLHFNLDMAYGPDLLRAGNSHARGEEQALGGDHFVLHDGIGRERQVDVLSGKRRRFLRPDRARGEVLVHRDDGPDLLHDVPGG